MTHPHKQSLHAAVPAAAPRRFRTAITVASALAMGAGMLAASSPAQAASSDSTATRTAKVTISVGKVPNPFHNPHSVTHPSR